MTGNNQHVYEARPRKDRRGVDLDLRLLPFGRLWYHTPDNAIGYAIHSSRSHNAVIRVYDAAGNSDRDARTQRRFQRALTRSSLLPNGFSHFKKEAAIKESLMTAPRVAKQIHPTGTWLVRCATI